LKKNRFFISFILLFLLSCIIDAKELAQKYKKLDAVSNGHGLIQFRWLTPPEFWSKKGWALIDTKTDKTLKQIFIADELLKLQKEHNANKADKKIKKALNMTLFKIFIDYASAKKYGFACEIKVQNHTQRRYKLVSIENKNIILKSRKVDAFKASPLPDAPLQLRAKNSGEAVKLFWKNTQNNLHPSIAYMIYRKNNAGVFNLLSNPSILTGVKWDYDRTVFTDSLAPLEKKVTYKVYGIDTFNRKSKPASVTIFHPDIQALHPPKNIEAKVKNDTIVISWKPNQNPFTAGYIVERGTWDSGFYNLLTAKPLSKKSNYFIDTKIKKDTNYLYRVSAVNIRGKRGKPSKIVVAKLLGEQTPKSVQKLVAKVYPSMIKLTWEQNSQNLLGYIIQKKYLKQDKWVNLNSEPLDRSEYIDKISYGAIGEVFYRVVAVGTNAKLAKPSQSIQVQLPGNLKLYAPTIKEISGEDAKVVLKYTLPTVGKKPSKIFIIRGNTTKDRGEIIAKISPDKTTFVDKNVRIGEDYWYGLQSVD